MRHIPQNGPVMDGNEKAYVTACLEENWLSSTGRFVEQFETEFAHYSGVEFVASCSSGTAALHLAFEALLLEPGDEVIVPNFTLIADSNMAILAGLKPVFVDVDPFNWCIDVSKIEARITPRTRAILCVHMYGHPSDMDALQDIADRHSLVLIEDAAEAHGSKYREKKVGGISEISCFSFYATKTLASGEGGAVCTNSKSIFEQILKLRSHGFQPGRRVYEHDIFGFNYRLTNLQAAVALAQVERATPKVEAKRKINKWYRERLEHTEGLTFQGESTWAESSYWNTAILLEEKSMPTRDEVVRLLREEGIETANTFSSLHRQPVYQTRRRANFPETKGFFPVSDNLSLRGVCLPSGSGITEDEVDYVCTKLKTILRQGNS